VVEGALCMAVRGDLGSATLTVRTDEAAQTAVECSEDTSLSVALKYLGSIVKAQSVNEQVTLFLSKGIPVHIVYDMGDRGSLGFHVAPKMEE